MRDSPTPFIPYLHEGMFKTNKKRNTAITHPFIKSHVVNESVILRYHKTKPLNLHHKLVVLTKKKEPFMFKTPINIDEKNIHILTIHSSSGGGRCCFQFLFLVIVVHKPFTHQVFIVFDCNIQFLELSYLENDNGNNDRNH